MNFVRHPKSGTVHATKMSGTLTRCGKDAAYLPGGYETRDSAVREALANGKARYCGGCFHLARGHGEIKG